MAEHQRPATPAPLRPGAPAQTFTLTEGARQELLLRGFTTVDGQLRSVDEVRATLKETGQDADLPEVPKAVTDEAAKTLAAHRREQGVAQYGVTHVYPSVEPGKIDPEVAGTPGISGPPAA